ncbi:cyclic pyranopterin monophosphate synthase MoaC [Methanotrichaceae archaeon M04Ac]|uniref:Probable cyclic pyranopterin monophosphate synthase n=1 Tax=Candidatus Methanocrinis alkalitolerans TaxID=3033395 RepID=A0ABT5XE08_9EURY|nr:cyclic pyranopterin monophosphate synthase MoaC [Candidatus Methanocrinis alkalitolerans]MDF0592885.1 cyclic pyranopterin monophosphate synthase MoaC [Candidatus Methanocrinis alkalitolerans]
MTSAGDLKGYRGGMVEITKKPAVGRRAVATGTIRLREETVEAIRRGEVKKGDVLTVARVAAIQAVKETPRTIPMCHPIPITGVEVDFQMEPDRISATVSVASVGRTGVEMEALVGVSAALLNVWDMVKYREKDGTGNYPTTCIEEIRVVEKRKGEG